ncbi:hypothetical protein LZG00_19145 [Rhodobacteraceae bacterium LMO-12]|nr:hypothetical protein [Rhodobacteraceae bacterium LMO-JJ12]
MTIFDAADWASADETEQHHRIRSADLDELNMVMRFYDWSHFPQTVIGWAAAQQGIELGAALAAFFNGDPMRFNYVPKRDVSEEYGPTVRLLDTVFQRINAGFYLPHPLFCDEKLIKLETWMKYQREDARLRQRGRWVFDQDVLEPILGPQVIGFDMETRTQENEQNAFSIKGLLKPLVG